LGIIKGRVTPPFKFIRELKMKEMIIAYFNEVIKALNETPVEVIFTHHHHGIACVKFRGNIVKSVEIDLDKVYDPELTVLHEIAHIVLIRKSGIKGHGVKFHKFFDELCERFMYSELSFKIFSNNGV
jgi:hypothetical protein